MATGKVMLYGFARRLGRRRCGSEPPDGGRPHWLAGQANNRAPPADPRIGLVRAQKNKGISPGKDALVALRISSSARSIPLVRAASVSAPGRRSTGRPIYGVRTDARYNLLSVAVATA